MGKKDALFLFALFRQDFVVDTQAYSLRQKVFTRNFENSNPHCPIAQQIKTESLQEILFLSLPSRASLAAIIGEDLGWVPLTHTTSRGVRMQYHKEAGKIQGRQALTPVFLLIALLTVGLYPKPSQAELPKYYSFKSSPQTPQGLESPTQLFTGALASKPAQALVSLIKWQEHFDKMPQPNAPYNRRQHYGTWVRDRRADGQCYNTRARVLMRDSYEPVTYRDNNPCIVDTGAWYDPFADGWYYQASDIQVDHMVPLKHSYVTGGWQWSREKKCMFSNYMETKEHLIPVSGKANTQKGDRGPDEYMPINKRYWCTYIKDWLRIKAIWELILSPEEGEAILSALKDAQCDTRDLQMTQKELDLLRSKVIDSEHPCGRLRFPRNPRPAIFDSSPEEAPEFSSRH